MPIEYDARDLKEAADRLRKLNGGSGVANQGYSLDRLGRDGAQAKRNVELLGQSAGVYTAFSENASKELKRLTKFAKSPVGKAASRVGSVFLGFAFDWALEQLKADVVKAAELVNKAGDTLGDAEARYIAAKAKAMKVLSDPQWYHQAREADLELNASMKNLQKRVRSVEEAAGLLVQQREKLEALVSATDKWQRELSAESKRLTAAQQALEFLAKNFNNIRS